MKLISMERNLLRCAIAGLAVGLTPPAPAPLFAAQASQVLRVPSKDGTLIAVECTGSGPSLVIAHGGIGDRSRWTPMFPLLSSRFTVCAMDRRGRGGSGDSPPYSLQKEAEDIASIVESRSGTVFLLGHSYGGVCALEAAFLTKRVSKLLLYEPPLQERVDLALVGRIEKMIEGGQREQAVVTFLREVVRVSPSEVDAMRTRPAWRSLLDSIGAHPRQMRALAAYQFDAKRMRAMTVPTLLIRGSETAIPDVKRAFDSLMASLPNRTEVVLEGQHHNAMDTGRQQLSEAITNFLLGTSNPPRRK
jgi:pimeloyl-ACP methyl ester carboxylesterase